jgi:alkylation response protein AidB-like acyl-CoA dehydrogenase
MPPIPVKFGSTMWSCPSEDRLGEEGQGYRIALANLEGGRIGIASQSVGMARAALEIAVQLRARAARLRQDDLRAPGGVVPLGRHGRPSLEAARQLTLHAAALKDAGQPCLVEASMAKLVASETAEKDLFGCDPER